MSPTTPDAQPTARDRSRRRSRGMLVVLAVVLTPFAVMPYFGLGADVSPNAHGHLQRRYGTVGMWLAGIWLVGVIALIVVTVLRRLLRRKPRTTASPG